MELQLHDTQKKITLNDAVFNYQYNEGLIHQSVTTYLSQLRSGNSAQKTRAEVRGGGKKPWNQKGTGNARAGSNTSPLWRKGGVIFAAKKRDYTLKLNKKMYVRALRSIFSELIRTGNLIVITDLNFETHKTKDFLKKINELSCTNALIIKNEITDNDYYSSRNLKQYEVCDLETIDPYILLRHQQVLITEPAIRLLEEYLQ